VDGVPIAMLLNVVDGRVAELEIYRVDGLAMRNRGVPAARAVKVNGPTAGEHDQRRMTHRLHIVPRSAISARAPEPNGTADG